MKPHDVSFSGSKGSLSEINSKIEVGSASIEHSKKSSVDTAPLLCLPCAPNQTPLKRLTEGLKKIFLDPVVFLSSFLLL